MRLFDIRMSGVSTEMVSHLVQVELPPTTSRYRFFSDDRDLDVRGKFWVKKTRKSEL
jgi:hypothetical protein